MTPQQPLDGNAIFAELKSIEKSSSDLRELETQILVLIAAIKNGKYNDTHTSSTGTDPRSDYVCGLNDGQISILRNLPEHDTAIRNATLKTCIEELDSLCNTRTSRYEDPEEPEDRREFLRGMMEGTKMARNIIESLRTKETAP